MLPCETGSVNDAKGSGMDFAPEVAYSGKDECTLVIFDVRYPDVAERLHRERAAWAGNGDLEALDEDHFVLIMRPNGSRQTAA